MKSAAQIQADYHNRMNYLDILDLASEVTEDDYGNATFKFITPVATAMLSYCRYDGDTSVSLHVPAQAAPVASLRLVRCPEIRAVNDKRGKYLELVGRLRLEQYALGVNRETVGFRLYLEPTVCLEPFFTTDG